MPRREELSADEQKLNDVFEEHLRSEFLAHSADQTMETMVVNPGINEILVMVGGDGREEVHEFYANIFASNPAACGDCADLAGHWSRKIGR